MPNRTLYVKDEDQEVWNRAQAAAEEDGRESLSSLATRLLSQYLDERQRRLEFLKAAEAGASRIEVTNVHQGHAKTTVFYGRWLIEDMVSNEKRPWEKKTNWTWSVAISRKGKIVVCHSIKQAGINNLRVYDSFAEVREVPSDVLMAAAKVLGDVNAIDEAKQASIEVLDI